MQTLTQSAALEETREWNYIHNFRELFWADKNIDDTIIAKQKEIFGFSLFLLHSKNIFEAVKIGILNSKNISRETEVGILFPLIMWGILMPLFKIVLVIFNAAYLFFPIIFILLFLRFIPVFHIIHEKIKLYKKSRILFNIDFETGNRIKKEFLEINTSINKWGANNFWEEIIFFLITQPFILVFNSDVDPSARLSLSELIIFELLIFAIIFNIFKQFIFVASIGFYSIYFFLLDHIPFLFSREDQERDFYMDLYESGNQLLTSLDALEKDITDAKSGIIQPSLWKNLSQAIHEIEELYTLIDEHAQLLEGKEKFQQFLIGMLNEILTVYGYIFDFLSERILSIESGINLSELDEIQQNQLLQIVKPILENKKSQLQKMKEMILSKRIG